MSQGDRTWPPEENILSMATENPGEDCKQRRNIGNQIKRYQVLKLNLEQGRFESWARRPIHHSESRSFKLQASKSSCGSLRYSSSSSAFLSRLYCNSRCEVSVRNLKRVVHSRNGVQRMGMIGVEWVTQAVGTKFLPNRHTIIWFISPLLACHTGIRSRILKKLMKTQVVLYCSTLGIQFLNRERGSEGEELI